MTNKKRNILFLTTGDQTGANTALITIAHALKSEGHNVQVLVRHKSGFDPMITSVPPREGYFSELGFVVEADGKRKRLKRDLKYLFNTVNENNSYQDTEAILHYLRFNPHIIFVGITFDFLTSTDICKIAEATQAVIYNAAVDMNHFTGGCHFAWDCEGVTKGCDTLECPAILDEKFKDLAARNFLIKKENVERSKIKVLAGSGWTLKQARESLIYKNQDQIFNIPGVVDTTIYNPKQRAIAKQAFDLLPEKFYILTGSENTLDERKGYSYFVETVNQMWEELPEEKRDHVEILSVSRILDEKAHDTIKFAKKHIPYINDERLLSLLYQAADIYVNSSLEDSGPSMLMQAMSCGTPVVSFEMGSASDYIFNGKTGFIVDNKDTTALAQAMLTVYNMQQNERDEIGVKGFERVEEIGSLRHAVTTIENILELHSEDFSKFAKQYSVALCTFNGEKYLAEQLDSILRQNLMPDEIVICDDGSTDSTPTILNKYRKKYPDLIKLHFNEINLGVVKNFEKAINLCTREFIFLCDQDDEWVPHKAEVVIRIFNNNPKVEAVSHNLHICYKDKYLSDYTMWDTMGFRYFMRQNYRGKNYLFHSIFFGNMVTGAALCIRKPLQPLKFPDHIPDVIHDYQMAIEHLTNGTIYFQDQCLGLYRQHEEQQIGPKLAEMQDQPTAIKTYYETNNPMWNLLYIRRHQKSAEIFIYLNETKNPAFNSSIKNQYITNMKRLLMERGVVRRMRGLAGFVISKVKRVGAGYLMQKRPHDVSTEKKSP